MAVMSADGNKLEVWAAGGGRLEIRDLAGEVKSISQLEPMTVLTIDNITGKHIVLVDDYGNVSEWPDRLTRLEMEANLTKGTCNGD